MRWYLLDVGDVVNFHTPHWQGGNLVTYHHARKDVFDHVAGGNGNRRHGSRQPLASGCFIARWTTIMQAGMMARYEVLP